MNARIDLAIAASLAEDSIDHAEETGSAPGRPAGFLRHLTDLIVPWSAFHLDTCRAHNGPDRT
ncbi:hypothetical protein SAMN02982929_07001 [Saccharopolyspora kobensis]|uniref:Uncharacterized protein n=1 Tax=Saccharopolyspora kobensis TaxID=146035 RepID=A0A1H6EK45_9PSEU|nr:hypothetical protein [Saccharopolyspora kobensis]SEG98220.1 hypothetical protein SAMN02982929_07001 [Saccharopolyspora kobensis]SFE72006.1 hypothetical protein SAMN05216506_113239 [Saccharopolyspora kobensis]